MKSIALAASLALASALTAASASAEEPPAPVPAEPAPVAAEPAPAPPMSRHDAECAASFPERLADAKRTYVEREKYEERFEKSGAKAKLEWFDAHCRLLSELEITVRKLDDPNAFVCDPKAKGRPKGLTSFTELAALSPPPYSELQGFRNENYGCEESDEKSRIKLVLHDQRSVVEMAELVCYQDERPMCVTTRENIAKVRAKGHR